MKDYPLVECGISDWNGDARKWSRADALAFARWVRENEGSRANGLMDFFNISDEALDDSEAVLSQLGERTAQVLSEPPFSEPHPHKGRSLTAYGYSLAMDMGFLLATLLRRNCRTVQVFWDLYEGDPSEVHHNRPVVRVSHLSRPVDVLGVSKAYAGGLILTRPSVGTKAWTTLFRKMSDPNIAAQEEAEGDRLLERLRAQVEKIKGS